MRNKFSEIKIISILILFVCTISCESPESKTKVIEPADEVILSTTDSLIIPPKPESKKVKIDRISSKIKIKKTADSIPSGPTLKKIAKLALDPFSEIPEEIDGCSCYFSRSLKEFQKGQYIYVNDYASTSFISIDGEMMKLQLKSHSDKPGKDADFISMNSLVELKIKINKKTDAGDEASRMEGIFMLKHLKTGKTKEIPFVGECGC